MFFVCLHRSADRISPERPHAGSGAGDPDHVPPADGANIWAMRPFYTNPKFTRWLDGLKPRDELIARMSWIVRPFGAVAIDLAGRNAKNAYVPVVVRPIGRANDPERP